MILDRKTSPVPFTRLKGAEWSPDGSRVAVLLEQAPSQGRWHAYTLNADGTGLRPLGDLGANPLIDQNSLLWSPDGAAILEVPQDGSGTVLIVDVTAGTSKTAPWAVA